MIQHRSFHGLSKTHAFQHRLGTLSARELEDVLHRLGAAFTDHVGGAKLACERDAIRMAAKEDNAFGSKALRGNQPAQAYCAITDDGDAFSGTDLGDNGCVVARSHDVR